MKNLFLSILVITFTLGSTNAQSKKVQPKFSTSNIISNYLTLKNALTKDDSKSSANAGKALYATLNAVKTNTIDAKLKKNYLDIAESAKENAKHIGDNAGKLVHQREHFVLLSKDVNDLIKLFGSIFVQW
jgi:hypothetical protein